MINFSMCNGSTTVGEEKKKNAWFGSYHKNETNKKGGKI